MQTEQHVTDGDSDMQYADRLELFANSAVDGVQVRNSFYTKYGKRTLDIVLVCIGLVVTLPIMLVVALITLLDVGRPVLFRQTRIGRNCRPFTIYKFRNMNNKKDENGVLLLAKDRVTKVGRIVRATSLDELPQMFNILKGDMSIIGPRPLLPEYLPRYSTKHLMRHAVRPGLECPTYYKLDHTWTWDEQFDSDIWYTEHCSLKVDIHLCFRIVQMVFNRKDNKMRSVADRGAYKEAEFGEIR